MLINNRVTLRTPNQQPHLLAGRQRPRIDNHMIERHHSLLRRRKILLLRHPKPERAQPQRVATEDDLVTLPGNDRRRPLRQRPECPPEIAVERLHRRVKLLALAPDRRKQNLDRLHQRDPIRKHQPLDRPVKDLRITRLVRQLDSQRRRLPRQPIDRVDLTIVAKRRKHLRLLRR